MASAFFKQTGNHKALGSEGKIVANPRAEFHHHFTHAWARITCAKSHCWDIKESTKAEGVWKLVYVLKCRISYLVSLMLTGKRSTDETPWAGGFTWFQQTACCLKHSVPPFHCSEQLIHSLSPATSSTPLHTNPHFMAACLSFPAIREQNTTGLTSLSCFTILTTGITLQGRIYYLPAKLRACFFGFGGEVFGLQPLRSVSKGKKKAFVPWNSAKSFRNRSCSLLWITRKA